MKKIKLIIAFSGILLTLILPLITLAACHTQYAGNNTAIVYCDIQKVVDILKNLLFALAAVFIVIAGYNFLMAKGDASKIEQAREQIVYALIAMAIGALAWGLAAWLGEKTGNSFPVSLYKATQFFL